MKKIVTLLFVFFLFSIDNRTFSQEPKKGDAKIIVIPSDTANLFKRVVLALLEKGYTIESKDEQLKYIASSEMALGSRSIKIRILIKDSIIIFSGQVANNVSFSLGSAKTERVFYNIYYGGMKGSDLRIAWKELDNFARHFGTNISYSK